VRYFGESVSGRSFDLATIERVWLKGSPILGYSPDVYRRDACGTVIARAEHGCTTSRGWEIDHILPVARGGSDVLVNLQPLYWQTNRRKGDSFPWSCAAVA
jgi:5-methylcytosine-specific restriction endonuclease McrA